MKLSNHKNINPMGVKNVFIIIFYILLIHSCKQKEEKKVDTTDPNEMTTAIPDSHVSLTDAQYKNAQLVIDKPQKTKMSQIIRLNGKIEVMPENIVTISTPMGGFVQQLKLVPGTKVIKGQTLLRLEDKGFIQLQQDYLTAKNAYNFAKLDFQRQTDLSQNQASSDKVLQQAEEKMKQFEIEMKSLAAKLKLIHINPVSLTTENLSSYMTIKSPMNGVITEIMVNTGKYVHLGDDMVKMVSLQGAKLVLRAFEKDLPHLRIGQKFIAYTNAQSDTKIAGIIEHIVSAINNEGLITVICKLNGASEYMIPGAYINAEVDAHTKESLTLPENAIVNFEGKEYVFKQMSKLYYEMVEVKSGIKDNGRVQILNDQELVNQKVVIKNAFTLLMKMKNVEE